MACPTAGECEAGIRNTQKSLNEIQNSIEKILKDPKVGSTHLGACRAASVRMVFSNSRVFGQCGTLAFHLCGERADAKSNIVILDSDLKWSLQWLLNHLRMDIP